MLIQLGVHSIDFFNNFLEAFLIIRVKFVGWLFFFRNVIVLVIMGWGSGLW